MARSECCIGDIRGRRHAQYGRKILGDRSWISILNRGNIFLGQDEGVEIL